MCNDKFYDENEENDEEKEENEISDSESNTIGESKGEND